MTYQTMGIVIKQRDWKDYDRVYTVYSQDLGKINFLARGIRRAKSKLSPKLHNFSEKSFFLAKGRMFDIIAGVNCQENFSNLYFNLLASSIAGYIYEVFDLSIKEGESDFNLYNLLKDFLIRINNKTETLTNKPWLSKEILSDFLAQFLMLSGYHLQFNNCFNCQTIIKNKAFFEYENNGLLCQSCLEKRKEDGTFVDFPLIKFISALFSNTISETEIEKIDLFNQSFLLLNSYLKYKMETDFKSEKMLNYLFL